MLEVADHDVQQIIHLTGQGVAGDHLIPALHALDEVLDLGAAVLFELDADEGLQAEADRSRVDQGRVAGNHAFGLEALHTTQAGRGRQADRFGDVGIGRAPVALQQGEDAQIGAIEGIWLGLGHLLRHQAFRRNEYAPAGLQGASLQACCAAKALAW